MRYIIRVQLIISFILISCAGLKEFQLSREYLKKNDYENAYLYIEKALNKKPNSKELLHYKEKILLKQMDQLNKEYIVIPKEDLNHRTKNVEQMLEILNLLSGINKKKYSDSLSELKKEFIKLKQKVALINELTQKIRDEFNSRQYKTGFQNLVKIKKYKKYDLRINELFNEIKYYYPALNKKFETLFVNKKFSELKELFTFLDEIYPENNISLKYKSLISNFYYKRSEIFLKEQKYSTSLAYLLLSRQYKKDNVSDEQIRNLYDDILNLKNEKIYINILGGITENDKQKYIESTFNIIPRKFNNFFSTTSSINNCSIAIIISVNRMENDISNSKPIKKYSKFISGYNRIPNEAYYKAKSMVDQTKLDIYKISLRNRTGVNGFIDALMIKKLRGYIEQYLNFMNSDAAYNLEPILFDYSYYQTDYTINNVINISYKILDMKNKNIPFEDSINKNSRYTIKILEEVHQNDANSYKNTGSFDYSKQKEKFNNFVDTAFKSLLFKITDNLNELSRKRGNEYLQIKEPAEAVESYFTGYFIKNYKTLLNNELPIKKIIPKKLYINLNFLGPESNLSNKLTSRTKSFNKSIVNNSNQLPKSSLTQNSFLRETLIEKSVRKVVQIKSYTDSDINLGSGFFVSSNGYIITNFHVVKNSSSIEVILSNNKTYTAEKVMTDSFSDLALLKISVGNVLFFKFKRFLSVKTGETVFAIGSPHGFSKTVSKGIVSAKREIKLPSNSSKLLQIQTDASITHGNSGGPLIDIKGAVIGINTWTDNIDGGSGALNFAISIDEVIKRFNYYISQN